MMRIYGFWRSAAAHRVRIALALKGLAFEETMIDLDAGAQHDPAYLAVNPAAVVPALLDGEGKPLRQSLAILEYLEETHPAPPLLPAEPRARARVRALALTWAADHHPLIVPRVRAELARRFGGDETARRGWIRHWFTAGLAAGEAMLDGAPETGAWCHGAAPTIADLCLASHVAGALHFGVGLDPFPLTARIWESCQSHPAFAAAHPRRQAGAPAG